MAIELAQHHLILACPGPEARPHCLLRVIPLSDRHGFGSGSILFCNLTTLVLSGVPANVYKSLSGKVMASDNPEGDIKSKRL